MNHTYTRTYRSGGSIWGVILILVGLAFLGDNLGWFSFDVWEVFWPILIIVVGLLLLLRRGRRVEVIAETGTGAAFTPPISSTPPPPPPPPSQPGIGTRSGTTSADHINESHLMGELDLDVDSPAFRGGAVSTVFGNIRIDCSRATLADGEHPLSINTVFGEVRLFVPPGWEYSMEATTVFGEVDAAGTRRGGIFSNVVSATPGYATATRRLRINASTVFGEVRVATR